MFHIVTAGQCALFNESDQPITLRPGTFTLMPHGEGHALASSPEAELTDLFDTTRFLISDRYELLVHGEGGVPCRMLCGAVRMDHPAARRLVQLLPKVIAVDTWASPQTEAIQSVLRLMASEVESPRPGGEAVITRLADVLVIQAIRTWMQRDPSAKTGWLGAMQDAQIGPVLQRVHADPERAWTVEDLAEEAAMSRSGFSARFGELVGETPMQYVRAWKMHAAAALLRDEGATVAQLAFRFGYDSEAAFSRAFKRVMGLSPGAVKRAAAASPEGAAA
jgi:AraC-like DNA-binding protein